MEAEEEADGNQGDGKHMWDDLVEGIGKEDRDHHQAQNGIFEKEHVIKAVFDAIFIEYSDQDHWSNDLHKQVMPMDARTAVFALSLEDDVANDGDIQVKGNLVST